MSDEQIQRLLYLFAEHENEDEMPPAEREEFRRLAAMFRENNGYLIRVHD